MAFFRTLAMRKERRVMPASVQRVAQREKRRVRARSVDREKLRKFKGKGGVAGRS